MNGVMHFGILKGQNSEIIGSDRADGLLQVLLGVQSVNQINGQLLGAVEHGLNVDESGLGHRLQFQKGKAHRAVSEGGEAELVFEGEGLVLLNVSEGFLVKKNRDAGVFKYFPFFDLVEQETLR